MIDSWSGGDDEIDPWGKYYIKTAVGTFRKFKKLYYLDRDLDRDLCRFNKAPLFSNSSLCSAQKPLNSFNLSLTKDRTILSIYILPQINKANMKFSTVVIGQSLIIVVEAFEIFQIRGAYFTNSEALLL